MVRHARSYILNRLAVVSHFTGTEDEQTADRNRCPTTPNQSISRTNNKYGSNIYQYDILRSIFSSCKYSPGKTTPHFQPGWGVCKTDEIGGVDTLISTQMVELSLLAIPTLDLCTITMYRQTNNSSIRPLYGAHRNDGR